MATLRKTALTVACFAVAVGACSAGDQVGAPDGPVDDGRLAGAADAPALDVIRDYVLDEGVPEELIERTETGILVARNQLDVAFRLGTTVGEVNATVDSVDGEIIGLVENAAVVLIRFPDPGNTVRLLEIRDELEARDGVEFAALAPMPAISMVPENLEPEMGGLPNTDPISHHLAARAHGAWNARRAIAEPVDKPLFILYDEFCRGDLGSDLDVSVIASDRLDLALAERPRCNHGYAVLSVVAGRFGGLRTPRELVTGMFPRTTELVIANDVTTSGKQRSGPDAQDLIIGLLNVAERRVILNTSYGHDCKDKQGKFVNCPASEKRKWNLAWVKKVRGQKEFGTRGAGLEDEFLHTIAAGNERLSLPEPFPSAPALGVAPQLFDDDGNQVPHLENTLIVESVEYSAGSYVPECLSDFSNAGGNIAAFGRDVYTSAGPIDPPKTNDEGTSLAAPQVAGVAQYLWTLDPSFTAREVAKRLLETADASLLGQTSGCRRVASAKVLDAYTTMLSVDERGVSPVRDAILDVDDSGQFDEKDLEVFVQELQLREDVDFSRYDLNGDGSTGRNFDLPVGGSFDLDMDGSIGTISTEVQGIEREFLEDLPRDRDILCYYAHSDLYDGEPESRDEALRTLCTGYFLELQVPSGRCPNDEVEVAVTARAFDPESREDVPAEGWIEVDVLGASPVSGSGALDESGAFRLETTIDESATELLVEARLYASQGGELLSRVSKLVGVDDSACQPPGSEECYLLTPSRAVYFDEGTAVSVSESYVSTTVGGVIERDTTTEVTFTCTKTPPCDDPDFQCEYKPRSCAPDPADNPPDDPSCREYCAWVGTQYSTITQTPTNGDPTTGEGTADVVALAPPRGRGPKCRRSDGQYFDWSGTETIEDATGSATYVWTHSGCKTASQDGGAPALVDYIPLTCCEVPQNATWVVCAAE